MANNSVLTDHFVVSQTVLFITYTIDSFLTLCWNFCRIRSSQDSHYSMANNSVLADHVVAFHWEFSLLEPTGLVLVALIPRLSLIIGLLSLPGYLSKTCAHSLSCPPSFSSVDIVIVLHMGKGTSLSVMFM